MPGSMSIGGIVSGLSTDDIIAKVMAAARNPQKRLQNDKTLAQGKLTAWQDLNTRVLALKLKCDGISNASTIISKQATTSNKDLVTATATPDAAVGTYYVKITSRAQAHQLSSQAYDSTETTLGTGTVSVSFANGESFDVTLDETNNTLAGLRDAINRTSGGASAVIINGGTAENPSYRLFVTSRKTGADYEMTIDTSGLAGGAAPVVDQEVQAATNATVVLGEGVGQITVTKSTNSFSDLIPGVTLNVASADPATTVRIDVSRNTASVRSAIEAFVAQYNDVADAIKNQFTYDAQSGETGLLFGSSQLQLVQSDLARAIGNTVEGVNLDFNSLASIGITLDSGGHLQINDSGISAALTNNPDDVARLFGSDMTSDSPFVKLVSTSADTQPSGSAGWAVNITQAARRAQVTAAVSLGGVLDADETLTVNGKSITLTAGMSLADVVSEINKYSSETRVSALATGVDGSGTGSYLTLRSTRYGSAIDFAVSSSRSNSSGASSGLGNVQVSGADPGGETGTGVGLTGLDVQGTINGEAATGNGQILTADPANDRSAIKGLVIQITSSTTLSTSIRYTKGVGSRLRDLLINMTSSKGVFGTTQASLTQEMSDLDDQIATWETRLSDQEIRLYEQFSRMETQLAQLKQQGDYLTAQLSSLNNNKK